jgi:ATP-binding cassette, subfamily B, bacterial PglK
VIARAQGQRIKAMQEGLGGIRDVILDQSQPVFIETFERAEAGYRNAKAKNSVLAAAPPTSLKR